MWYVRYAPVAITDEQVRVMFRNCDVNRDGKLSKEELKEGFRQLSSKLPWWRASRALHQADRNGDGNISHDELDDLIKYALKCGYTFH